MKCPHCNKELRYPDYAYNNADQYNNSVVVATKCCGRAIRLEPVRQMKIEAVYTTRREDDWGNPIKKDARDNAKV